MNGERNYWRGPAGPAYIALDLSIQIVIKTISLKNSPDMDGNRYIYHNNTIVNLLYSFKSNLSEVAKILPLTYLTVDMIGTG